MSFVFLPFPPAEPPPARYEAVRQLYRCPEGHLTEILWTAAELALVIEEGELRLYCSRCDAYRHASLMETNSILEALGLPPR